VVMMGGFMGTKKRCNYAVVGVEGASLNCDDMLWTI
jgi:hypothetical protein